MKNKTIMFLVWMVIVITWIVAFIYEPKLPEQVPTHWNADGEVDGYTSKPWGVYLLPIISTVMTFFISLMPKISPKGFKLDAAKKVYNIIILLMALFMLFVMILSFEAGLNKSVDLSRWMIGAMGVLFVIIGNYLSKVPKNFFLGIRTPWTLASDEVWYKTHRVGSWTFVLGGVLAVLSTLTQVSMSWLIWILVIAALVPVVYSLIIYKKVEGFGE